jgi:hypothetical protein
MIDDLEAASPLCFGFPMTDSPEKLAAIQNLWNVHRAIYARRGVDVAKVFAGWAEQKRQSLQEYSATDSFDDLCKYGCAKLPLAIALGIIRPLDSFGPKWQRIMGGIRQREQKIRALEKAANVLEDLLGSAADEIIADFDKSMDTENLNALRNELVSPGENVLKTPPNNYVPHPAVTISTLRMYASILQNTSDSPDGFARYLISAYVYRTTGDFHDAEVSSLIGAARDDPYDPTAHRMWRNRNYEQLDKSLSFLADLLTDFGKVSD